MLRRFAGADPGADEAVLMLCLTSAKQWYEASGVPSTLEGTELYDFWVSNLAAWFYDNRGATGPDACVPPFILASVHQLRPAIPAEEVT